MGREKICSIDIDEATVQTLLRGRFLRVQVNLSFRLGLSYRSSLHRTYSSQMLLP